MAHKLRYTLDLQLFAQDKTEPATPKKRQDTRKKGQVAKSMEIPAALVMLGGFAMLALYGGVMGESLVDLFAFGFEDFLLWEITEQNVNTIFSSLLFDVLLMMLPIFGIGVLMALLASYAQVGYLFTLEPLKMKFDKINPIRGLKQIFSLRSLVQFLKSILKITLIGVVAFLVIWGEKDTIVTLSAMPIQSAFEYIASLTLRLGLFSGGALLVLALFDYMYQKWEYEKNLRMSKQEVKDEFKKTEGDPLIKAKIRERQRKMAMQRMMQEVPKADVVITNPTHYAVALQYDGSTMDAPKVIAKGVDEVAQRIKQVAKEHDVPLMENKPLARALYAQVEIGESIPQELFHAVAEVLAFVYKTRGKAMQR